MGGDKFYRTLDKEVESVEKTDGIKLADIQVGEKFKISTQNTDYILELREDGYYLSGDKKLVPVPRKVQINGSTWGGNAIKSDFIGIGMHMEIGSIQGYDMSSDRITTSAIKSIEKIED